MKKFTVVIITVLILTGLYVGTGFAESIISTDTSDCAAATDTPMASFSEFPVLSNIQASDDSPVPMETAALQEVRGEHICIHLTNMKHVCIPTWIHIHPNHKLGPIQWVPEHKYRNCTFCVTP